MDYLDLLRQVEKGQGRWNPQAGYVGGKLTRMTSSFRPKNRTADAEIKRDWELLTARARWLARNNPVCSGALDTLVDNVVGEGIQTRACVRDRDRNLLKDWNREADDLYKTWMDEAHAQGEHHWYDLTRLNFQQTIESGESLLVQSQDTRGDRLVPMCFECIEPDQIDLTRDRPAGDNVNEIRRGIELDSRGRRVAYYLYTEHPGGIYSGYRRESERVPAWRVIHLFRKRRPSQTRGVTWFAPLVKAVWDLYGYMEHEIEAAKVASYFVYMLKREDVGDGDEMGFGDEEGESSPEDAYGNAQAPLGPGIGLVGGPNDSLEVIQSNRPNSQAEAWINLLLQVMGRGIGLSQPRFTGDFSKVNFSSARAADLQDRKGFGPLQSWHAWTIDLEVRRRVTRQFIAQGLLTIPSGGLTRFERNPRRWLAAKARPPGWGYVDPGKQVAASIQAIKGGLSTWERELASLGLDRDDVFETLAEEFAEARRLGLPLEQLLTAAVTQQSTPPAQEPEEEEEEELDGENAAR